MKKLLVTASLLVCVVSLFSQNVGIGTNNPSRARLVINGRVGNTTALFGGETTGLSFQSNFPTIGFNEYYNNGHRYIAAGYAAQQFFDPAVGYMAFDIFPTGNKDATASTSKRVLALSKEGDVIVGTGTSRLSINKNPDNIGLYNAALQIQQSVESNNVGISLTDMNQQVTWKLGSRNLNDGVLVLGINQWEVGYFNGAGEYFHSSDRRRKKDIQLLSPVLDKLMGLQPVQYTMSYSKPSGQISIGLIAQELKKVFPALVHVSNDSSALHAINYSGLAVLAVKAIQEQQKIIEALEAKIGALEIRMSTTPVSITK
jgi:hypothetical protein